jgi:large subunit GTPase 1
MHNPYLLTEEQETEAKRRHRENRERLKVPRRPGWSRDMDKTALEKLEREEFLEWRKGLAE